MLTTDDFGTSVTYHGFLFFSLQKCLCVLNISDNNIDSIEELKCLKNMTQFFAENNCLSDMKVQHILLCFDWTVLSGLWKLKKILLNMIKTEENKFLQVT